MLETIKNYAFIAILAATVAGGWVWGKSEYAKGHAAAVKEQTDAIVAYQKIVVDKERQHTEEIQKLTTEHTTQINAMQAAIPPAQEKIRVITKTIERPAVCDLGADELRLLNEAVRSANGNKPE